MSDATFRLATDLAATPADAAFRQWHGAPHPERDDAPMTDDPYARGLTDGQQLAATAFQSERQQLLALFQSAEALQPEPSDELAQMISETVERLVRQIVEQAPIDAAWLQEKAAEAATLVAECDAARTLWLHPDDIALLVDSPLPIPMHADPDAERGSIRIECSAGWIEHGRALYLEELRDALGCAEVPA